jgi:hypothetical protein
VCRGKQLEVGADLTNGPRQLQDVADPALVCGRWASSWGARAGRRARLGAGPGKGQWAAGRPGGKRAQDSWVGGQRAAGPQCTWLEGLLAWFCFPFFICFHLPYSFSLLSV